MKPWMEVPSKKSPRLTDEERKARFDAAIKRVVDAAPPLTPDQARKLAVLFAPYWDAE